jgi:hypothetical protein
MTSGVNPRERGSSAVKRSRDLERRIDGFYSVCEKILLRTLIFGCFVLELSRFAKWLLR